MENYPRENLYAMLNLLGSHDVERLRTLLEARYEPKKARALNGLLRAWQMTLPGLRQCITEMKPGSPGAGTRRTGSPSPGGRRTNSWKAAVGA